MFENSPMSFDKVDFIKVGGYMLVAYPAGHKREVNYFNKVAFKGHERVYTLLTFDDFLKECCGCSWDAVENMISSFQRLYNINKIIVWLGKVEVSTSSSKKATFISSNLMAEEDDDFKSMLDLKRCNFGS